MNQAAALRFAYQPHAAKNIAREFGVAIVTAKLWLSGRVPLAREEELRARILARLDERDRLSADIRRQWGEERAKANPAVDRGQIVELGALADRAGPVRSNRG